MSFIAILIALLLEQARPLARSNGAHASMRSWVRSMLLHLDAGRTPHAWLAWGMAVVFPAWVGWAIYLLLDHAFGFLAGTAWSVLMLYLTLGFRQFSHRFTAIRDALDDGDEPLARTLLAEWKQIDVANLPRTEILRQVMEHSIINAHRHVFGVLAWYAVFSILGCGPAGAVLYRMAEFVPRYCVHQSGRLSTPISRNMLLISQQLWHGVDWLPARLTALAFAVVGSFEDAVDGWRNAAGREGAPLHNDSVILGAAGGAMNVRLTADTVRDASDAGGGPMRAEPTQDHLKSLVGLVWRAVVLSMVVLALVGLGR